ncbi:MAG: hypothetical protein K1X74_21525 [Pirellulales bacterium]|nr:hypothetical protein [Pirellulales bacterium]
MLRRLLVMTLFAAFMALTTTLLAPASPVGVNPSAAVQRVAWRPYYARPRFYRPRVFRPLPIIPRPVVVVPAPVPVFVPRPLYPVYIW